MHIAVKSYAFLILCFGFVALCSNLTPYFANDFRYMQITGTHDLISSVQDIFISQYRHYFTWGGRSVAHFIAQLLLYTGKPVSAVIQAFAFVLLILFCVFNALGIRPTLKIGIIPVFFVTAALFLQLRAVGEVIFNTVSSANYMYTTLLILIFILPYRLSMTEDNDKHGMLFALLMIFAGLAAGWSNESSAAAVAAGIGLYLLYLLMQKRLKLWQITGYAGFLTGFALLIFAPGNIERLRSMEGRGFSYTEHLDNGLAVFAETLLVSLPLLAALSFVLYRGIRYGAFKHFHKEYAVSLWFALIGLLSLILMIFSPNFPVRASFCFTVFTVTALTGMGNILLQYHGQIFSGKVCRILISSVALFSAAVAVNMVYLYALAYKDETAREAEIFGQLNAGSSEIVVSPMHVRTYKYLYAADVRADENYWTNKILADFLQVKSVRRKADIKKYPLHYDFVFFASSLSEDDLLQYKTGESNSGKD